MNALTHVSSDHTVPPEGNPSTADIAYYSVVDLGTFTPDAVGNPTTSPDVTYLVHEIDTDVVHVSRDRFNLVQKNADVYFGRLPVGDSWALVWSELRALSGASRPSLPITELFLIASYDGGAHHDFLRYVRFDGAGNLMPAFYSLPSPVELCGMIEDKSGVLGALDYIDVRVFFGECNSGCETANPVMCKPLWINIVDLVDLANTPEPAITCVTCRGKALYISYYVSKAVAVTLSPLVCATAQDLAARSEIQNILNTYGGQCPWVQEIVTAKYYVPTAWGIPFQASLADLTAAIAHLT